MLLNASTRKPSAVRLCLKVGNLARVCQAAGSRNTAQKDAETKAFRHNRKHGSVKLVDVGDGESDSDSEDHLDSIFQLGKESNKYMIAVKINGIMRNMEVDSGAERSTVSKSLFEEKLSELSPSAVSLHQYDHYLLTIAGECCVNVEFNGHKMKATCVVVDITGKHPYAIDLTALVNQYAMQVTTKCQNLIYSLMSMLTSSRKSWAYFVISKPLLQWSNQHYHNFINTALFPLH